MRLITPHIKVEIDGSYEEFASCKSRATNKSKQKNKVKKQRFFSVYCEYVYLCVILERNRCTVKIAQYYQNTFLSNHTLTKKKPQIRLPFVFFFNTKNDNNNKPWTYEVIIVDNTWVSECIVRDARTLLASSFLNKKMDRRRYV